ncbi:hypothetical protein H1R17_10570 [Flavobacterium sp. xlx-214]|uniref:hypothetical protein n=1 Tax=unclassified Flavobacterium TaxID=196869 RepID=UPI0013D82D65|nr:MULTISPECIES: hypothetical protein [unclassified Flavobacterium]MBA5791659.1 hypothetical protein [Flavobacterium sp. xlx-221]QMI82902.1 hypothetical protein H1R17_10570 [Flavobacterium sp. xlx-214]
MCVFSYHLVKVSFFSGLKLLFFKLNSKNIEGLIHAEKMTCMTLGSAILSPKRFMIKQQVLFAQWENEESLDSFLSQHTLGKQFAKGWHTRLHFLRKWGTYKNFRIPENTVETIQDNEAVVVVTIARMKFLEIPRFIAWGRPVEKQVSNNPNTLLSLASIHFPNTVSTFSIWKTQKDMTNMVFGHGNSADSKRHVEAMKERNRKDFHFEFTTLRFKPIAEFGSWNGRTQIIKQFSTNS